MRKDNPDGIAFLEYYMVEQAKERAKQAKRSKAKRRR